MNWNDLRYTLALGEEGTLSAAAKRLGVTHATVHRRVERLEAELGVRLFDRGPEGFIPTPAGEEAMATASDADSRIVTLERRLAGRDREPAGHITLTTTDTLYHAVVAEMLAAFMAAYPRIDVDCVISNRFLSLSRRDADMAIRPTRKPRDTLVGVNMARIAMAPYGPADGADGPWIVPDESLADLPATRWAWRQVPDGAQVMRLNTLHGMLDAARAAGGHALLPCFMGDPADGLRRLGPPVPDCESALWLLVHRDLRRVARIRRAMDFFRQYLTERRPLFEGDA